MKRERLRSLKHLPLFSLECSTRSRIKSTTSLLSRVRGEWNSIGHVRSALLGNFGIARWRMNGLHLRVYRIFSHKTHRHMIQGDMHAQIGQKSTKWRQRELWRHSCIFATAPTQWNCMLRWARRGRQHSRRKKGMSLLCERAQRKRFFFSPPSKCQNQFPISTLEEKMQRARIRENFAENLSSNSAVSSSAVQWLGLISSSFLLVMLC